MGQSPLQAMLEHKKQNPNLKDSVMVYAGRLDPMAEGVMIVLSDQDRFNKDEYLSLDKTYEATVLFGFESDTFDALGLVEPSERPPYQGGPQGVADTRIVDAIKNLKGTHNLPFPNYSSYKVQGKPLHWWTKQGRLGEVEIPLKEMKVMNIDNIEISYVSSRPSKASGEISNKEVDLLSDITNRINKVDGDFRQEQIIEQWKELLAEEQELTIAKFTIEVSSGTYVRSLADLLGKQLGSEALLLNLKRTKVGKFDILDAIQV